MSVIDTLTTDRAFTDVELARDMSRRGWAQLTAAEKTAWLAGLKGAYNAADLNRVEQAVNYVAGRLNAAGYPVTVSTPRGWAESDIPTKAQLDAYLADVAALRAVLPVPTGTPETPEDMDKLTYTEANDIESIILIVDTLLDNMMQSWFCSGDLYSGEV